jgi:hypothetical protein
MRDRDRDRDRGWDRFKDLATESDAGADETVLKMFLRLPLGFETCPCPCPCPFVFIERDVLGRDSTKCCPK